MPAAKVVAFTVTTMFSGVVSTPALGEIASQLPPLEVDTDAMSKLKFVPVLAIVST